MFLCSSILWVYRVETTIFKRHIQFGLTAVSCLSLSSEMMVLLIKSKKQFVAGNFINFELKKTFLKIKKNLLYNKIRTVFEEWLKFGVITYTNRQYDEIDNI